MPFFLRHYMDYADRIVIQDCGSRDRTKQIVKEAGVDLIETEPWGMDEVRRRDESMQFVRACGGRAEWCACVDADEFLIGDFDRAFDEANAIRCDVLFTVGWSMTCDGLPQDDGRQIYDICDRGILGGCAKPCIARSGLGFVWSSGRHFVETRDTKVMASRIHLLHYRWLGYEYTRARNSRNYGNSPDKGTAWACADSYTGIHSTAWSKEVVGTGSPALPEVVKSLSGDYYRRFHGPEFYSPYPP